MITIVSIINNKGYTKQHTPKVNLEKWQMRQFGIYAYTVFEHIFYGYLEWDLIFKPHNRHSMYINRLSQPNIIVTKSIPFHQLVYVANVIGYEFLLDMTFVAEHGKECKINHNNLRKFIARNYIYE